MIRVYKLSQLEKIIVVWLVLGWTWLVTVGWVIGLTGFDLIPELVRVTSFYIWSEVLMVLTLLDWLGRVGKTVSFPHLDRSGKLLGLALMMHLGWIAITAVLGENPAQSFWGNYYRQDGLLTLAHLAMWVVMIGLWWREIWGQWLWLLIALSGIVLSLGLVLMHVWQWAMVMGGWPDRVIQSSVLMTGGFGHPAYLAGFLVLTLPFIWFLPNLLARSGEFEKGYEGRRREWLRGVGLVSAAAAIILTQSTGATLALVIFFGMTLFASFRRRALRIEIIVLIGVAVFVTSTWIYVSQLNSYEGRPRIFHNLWSASQQRPIIGWGWANIDSAFKNVEWPYPVQFDVYLDKAHSHMLEILVATGWPGLIIYLAFISILLLIAFSKYRKITLKKRSTNQYYLAILMCLVLYIFHSQTNVISIMEEIIFWFCVGLVIDSTKVI